MIAPVTAGIQVRLHNFVGHQRSGMKCCFFPAYLVHVGGIPLFVIAKESTPVLEHGFGRLLRVIESVISLPQVVFNDADVRPESGKGFAVIPVGHAKMLGDHLSQPYGIVIGSVHRRQPFAEQ